MILDLQTTFSGATGALGVKTGQAITGTAISTNVVDLRPTAGNTPTLLDEGLHGSRQVLLVQTLQAFTLLTSLTISLESAANEALSSGPVVHWTSGAVLLVALTANTILARVPLPAADYKRYLGLRYTVTGTNPGAGSILASLVPSVQRDRIHATSISPGV